MNQINLGDLVKRLLLGEVPEDLKTNSPFIEKGGLTHLRFDKIEISLLNDNVTPDLKITFYWNNRETHWMRVENLSLDNGDILTLTGIDGSQRVDIT